MKKKTREERKNLIIQLVEDSCYVPMKEKELAIFMQVEPEEREELKSILQELLNEGSLQMTKRGKYIKGDGQAKQQVGTFISNSRGFGFVEVEGQEEDLFIPEDYTGGAFHLDTVQVELLKDQRGKRKEARVTGILMHGIEQVVGTYDKCKSFGFVIPDNEKLNTDIFIPVERSKGAVTGHKVVAQITDYGDTKHKPEGKIIEILGHVNDPGVDILSIVKGFALPTEFPERVLNQAERVAKEVSEADRAGRKDLRQLMTVTIDGEDAKDLDDAISLSYEDGKYNLGVHIADVSNYVQENSVLDREALERGTSVYLVDRVIPMLPHVLSNGMCSLNMGEDRLALSCLMTVDQKGNVIDHEIVESVIRVDERMNYTDVNKILEEHDPVLCRRYEAQVSMFHCMKKLADILREKRKSRGSIDFDFPESKIELDKEGNPISIKPYERRIANKIIEDFMLIANETVAQDYFWQELPFVYRTHDNPDTEKIKKLGTFINNFGYTIHIGQDEIHPKELQKLLMKIDGTPEEALISRLTLRSMKQAKYTTENTGHFGLAASCYCHFTSPIRRYPDLQIHRIIKETLRGRMNHKRMAHYETILPEVAKHSSETERRADEAERETEKLKKAQYMAEHIGEVYEGVISGVTSYGMYVELPNTVEGLVHVTSLTDDYYQYFEDTFELVGEVTNRHYKLGQKVYIRVIGVDEIVRTIDFELAEATGTGEMKNGKRID